MVDWLHEVTRANSTIRDHRALAASHRSRALELPYIALPCVAKLVTDPPVPVVQSLPRPVETGDTAASDVNAESNDYQMRRRASCNGPAVTIGARRRRRRLPLRRRGTRRATALLASAHTGNRFGGRRNEPAARARLDRCRRTGRSTRRRISTREYVSGRRRLWRRQDDAWPTVPVGGATSRRTDPMDHAV